MIKKSAIFIVVNQQNRLRPQCGVRAESTDDKGKNILPKKRRRRRVIRSQDRPYQPGYLGQIVERDIGEEVDGKLGSKGILMQHRCRILEILEIGEHIVRQTPPQN